MDKEKFLKALWDGFHKARMGGLQPISTEELERTNGGATYTLSVFYFNGKFIHWDGMNFKLVA